MGDRKDESVAILHEAKLNLVKLKKSSYGGQTRDLGSVVVIPSTAGDAM
jgi:hypothetical protein